MKIKSFVVEIIREERKGFFFVKLALYLLSLFFQCGQYLRNCLYNLYLLKSYKIDLPVISVGNIVAGGSGKTPFVIALAKKYTKPAVVLRGYGSKLENNKYPSIVGSMSSAEIVGDEALLLKRNLPHAFIIVCKDRVRGASLAKQLGAEVVILDDGFQHRRIKRDEDIVIIDAQDPFGRGYFLPRGFLRESPHALKRATQVVINGESTKLKEVLSMYTHAPIISMSYEVHGIYQFQDDLKGESIHNRKVAVFCGIGNPERFLKTVENMGADVVGQIRAPDHLLPSFDKLQQFALDAKQRGAELLLCTEKDRVKMENWIELPLPLYWVGIDAKVTYESKSQD